ncbi:unnamed protein product [Bursaphelenchus okinawaensis]|uniref:Carbohydrate sulfotransferase n=1 Tax=Bursaphelenchus okinawaensis TaxID=465554 RepID=A0A811L920_9BILA|nr:unnamed protein product [Bursaphelenchus okinawaensis]CAG9118376.1 unnamed protein product [Bursaphelenchus okinawaensis]
MTEWTKHLNPDGSYTTFTFVRDPVQRFLSAYVDKCVIEPAKTHIQALDCYDCGSNMECFIHTLHNRLWKFMNGTYSLSVMDKHVIPQTWHCQMKDYMRAYKIFRYVSTTSDEYNIFVKALAEILESHNVPQKHIAYVIDGLTSGESPHTTSKSTVRYCQEEIERLSVDEWTIQFNQPHDYTVFTVVRDPIERFISAFVDKCVFTGYNALYALPPFHNVDAHMIYVDRYKLGACLLPKCMSTIMTGVLCYLYDDKAFTNANRSIATEAFVDRFCGDTIDSRDMKQWTSRYNRQRDYTVLTFVRDPIDRFLSAFVDKCDIEQNHPEEWRHLDCYGCERNVECFIRKLKDRLWNHLNGKHGLTMMDIHVVPQTWHCSMKTYMSYYKVFRYVSSKSDEYQVFLSELKAIFEDRNIPQEQISYVMKELNVGHSHHSTSNSSVSSIYRNELMSKPELIKILVDLYYYDYVTFGLPFPKF